MRGLAIAAHYSSEIGDDVFLKIAPRLGKWFWPMTWAGTCILLKERDGFKYEKPPELTEKYKKVARFAKKRLRYDTGYYYF
jgi:hypothetical protein